MSFPQDTLPIYRPVAIRPTLGNPHTQPEAQPQTARITQQFQQNQPFPAFYTPNPFINPYTYYYNQTMPLLPATPLARHLVERPVSLPAPPPSTLTLHQNHVETSPIHPKSAENITAIFSTKPSLSSSTAPKTPTSSAVYSQAIPAPLTSSFKLSSSQEYSFDAPIIDYKLHYSNLYKSEADSKPTKATNKSKNKKSAKKEARIFVCQSCVDDGKEQTAFTSLKLLKKHTAVHQKSSTR